MSAQAYLLVVAAASGVLGLWVFARLGLAVSTLRGAFLCFAVAWTLPGLAPPLVHAALGPLPAGFAILAGALPVLTASFAATAACLRYFADRLRHAMP